MTVQNVPVSTAFPDIVDLFWSGSQWLVNAPNPDGTTTVTSVPPPGPGNTGFLGGFLGSTPFPNSGTISVQGGIGALTGNSGQWTFTGNAAIGTIGEFSGPMTYTTAPGSTVTAHGAYISLGSNVDLTSVTDATFAGNSGTLGINGSKNTFQVEGFVPGDTIDFIGQPNLTLSAKMANLPNTQVGVFAGNVQVYTINFDSNTNIGELEPVSDGNGGTKIVFDTSPQITNFDPVINGSNIDWSFIHTAEAPGGVDVLAPYVPNSGHSGVTIGLGVDLANVGFTPAQFDSILGATNVAENSNLKKLEGAVDSGLTRAAAVSYISPAKAVHGISGVQSQAISITPQQAALLDQAAETKILTRLETNWAAASSVSFSSLPKQAQTVLADLAFNIGPNFQNTKAAATTWADFLTAAQTVTATSPGSPTAWAAVVNDLSHYASNSSRRLQDAALIRSIPGVVGPPAPVSEPDPPTSASDASFSFSATVGVQYALEVNGSEIYTLTEGIGSRPISALQLPTASDDAAEYSVSFLIGTTLSAPVTAAAGAIVAAPAGATGAKVTLLDASGAQITSPGDLTFYLNFAATGNVAVNVIGNEPPIADTFIPSTLPTGGNPPISGVPNPVPSPTAPTINAVTPSPVEKTQTTVIGTVTPHVTGDVLTLVETAGIGTLSLGAVQTNGTQQVIYTAPASVAVSTTDVISYTITENGAVAGGNAAVQLDSGPSITAVPASPVSKGQTTEIGTVAPGLAGDTLTLTQTGGTGTVALQLVSGIEEVIYTAPANVPAGITDTVSYTITDQHNDAVATGNASVQLRADPSITTVTPAAVEKGQTTQIGTVTPGLAGDTLTLTQIGGTGTVALQLVSGVEEVVYTAPASILASTTDTVSYTVTENGVAATASATVQLDAGPSIAPATPVAVGKGQTTVIGTVTPGLAGDTLTLTQAAGSLGTLSLGVVQGNGARQVIYTAPATVTASAVDKVAYTVTDQHNDVVASGSADVQLNVGAPSDPGPSVTLLPFVPGAANKAITVATATAGLPADTLSLVVIQAPQSGTLALQGNSVQFSPGRTSLTNLLRPVTFSFEIKDQLGNVTPTATVIVGGALLNNVTGSKSGNTDISLGDGLNRVTLSGSGNVVDAGSGVNIVSGGTGNSTVILGNGLDSVTLGGGGNKVTVGSGANSVSVGGSGNQIRLGSGSDVVHGSTGDTITLTGNNTKLDLYGTNEIVFIGGSGATIDDHSQRMTLVLSGNVGNIILEEFARDPAGVIDLRGGLGGFTTPQAVIGALQTDHHGGTLLSLGHGNSVDFAGTAKSQLHASNFQIG